MDNGEEKEDSYYEELIPKLYKPVPKIGTTIIHAEDQELPFVVEPAPEPEPAVVNEPEPEPAPEPEPDPEPEPEPEPEPPKPTVIEKLRSWLESFVKGEE